MHPLLARQLRRLKLDENTPPDAQTWHTLIHRLGAVFSHNDQTLSRLDRSLKISSAEMQGMYESLHQKTNEAQQQRDQLNAVLNAVQAGVCAIAPDGTVLFINNSGRELLNLGEDVALPPASTLLAQFHEDNHALSLAHISNLLRGKATAYIAQCNLRLADKDTPFNLHLSTLEKSDHNRVIVIVFQDMTESLRTEKSKLQAQKMASIANLVGGIAHELNNMLAGITGNLFLAKTKLTNHADVTKHLDTSERLSFDMGDIISHLMAFSGQSIASREHFSFKDAVLRELHHCKTLAHSAVICDADICEHSLEAFGAEEQIQQMIRHILQNALDATSFQDTPLIQVSLQHYVADKTFCDKHHTLHQHYAKLSIQDNGYGIDQDHLAHIYDPFYTGREFSSGKGLGLSMVQGTIQTHRGVIEVSSQLHQGTTFHVYFPLEQQDNNALENRLSSGQTEPMLTDDNKPTILLVEDEPNVQEMTLELLSSFGYQVITAADGLEAIEIYTKRQHEIDLTIMDIMMPNMTGTTAWAKIHNINPCAKVIFVSGYHQDSTSMFTQGFEHEPFLCKPFEIDQLFTTITTELEKT